MIPRPTMIFSNKLVNYLYFEFIYNNFGGGEGGDLSLLNKVISVSAPLALKYTLKYNMCIKIHLVVSFQWYFLEAVTYRL